MSDIELSIEDKQEYEEKLALVEAGVLDANQADYPQEATEGDITWLPEEDQE